MSFTCWYRFSAIFLYNYAAVEKISTDIEDSVFPHTASQHLSLLLMDDLFVLHVAFKFNIK